MTDRTCSTLDCAAPPKARGMCSKHYQRWYKREGGKGSVQRRPARRDTQPCSLEGCDAPYHSKGLCRRHYNARYHAEHREALLVQMRATSRSYYLRNREEVIARTRERQKANPDRYRAYARERYRANPEREAALKAARRARNPHVYRSWDAEYARRNPHLMRIKTQRRKARKRQNGTYLITARDLRRALIRHQHRCAYCRAPLGAKFDWDHVVPISRGGAHSVGNLVPACIRCNRSKHNLTVTEWRVRDARRLILAG